MIKVFSPTDTVFTTNGDAVIKGLRAVVRKADNSYFELELESGLEYIDYIKPNNIIAAGSLADDLVSPAFGKSGFKLAAFFQRENRAPDDPFLAMQPGNVVAVFKPVLGNFLRFAGRADDDG